MLAACWKRSNSGATPSETSAVSDGIAEIAECGTDNWCRMEVKGYKGWLRRDDFWGTYPDEVFEGN